MSAALRGLGRTKLERPTEVRSSVAGASHVAQALQHL